MLSDPRRRFGSRASISAASGSRDPARERRPRRTGAVFEREAPVMPSGSATLLAVGRVGARSGRAVLQGASAPERLHARLRDRGRLDSGSGRAWQRLASRCSRRATANRLRAVVGRRGGVESLLGPYYVHPPTALLIDACHWLRSPTRTAAALWLALSLTLLALCWRSATWRRWRWRPGSPLPAAAAVPAAASLAARADEPAARAVVDRCWRSRSPPGTGPGSGATTGGAPGWMAVWPPRVKLTPLDPVAVSSYLRGSARGAGGSAGCFAGPLSVGAPAGRAERLAVRSCARRAGTRARLADLVAQHALAVTGLWPPGCSCARRGSRARWWRRRWVGRGRLVLVSAGGRWLGIGDLGDPRTTRPRRATERERDRRGLRAGALVRAAWSSLNPLGWAHYALLLLLPAALAARGAQVNADRRARALAGGGLALLSIPKETLLLVAGPLPGLFTPIRGLALSAHLLGALLLFASAARGAFRSREAGA